MLGAEGIPDGFAQPIRHYQALDVEYNTNLTKHLQTKINYRCAKLFGKYEGFYRNDNGQSDTGIRSLFDCPTFSTFFFSVPVLRKITRSTRPGATVRTGW